MSTGAAKPIAYTRAKLLVLSDRAAALERRGHFQEAAECWQEAGQFSLTPSDALWCESRSALCLYQRDRRELRTEGSEAQVCGDGHRNG